MSPAAPERPVERGGRLLSLDAFRGLTIAGMILVNNPGSPTAVYSPLKHAAWHGWTPTDLIFPSFLFIAGVAIPLALGRRLARGASRLDLFSKVVSRAVIIFALGLFLNAFPFQGGLATLRYPGVLQRIAVCYLVAALVYLTTGPRVQALMTAGLLLGYWLVMTTIPAPGFAAGDLSRPGNLAAAIDRAVLPGRLYKPEYDPEGLLSTVPAIASALIGVLAGHWLAARRAPLETVAGLLVAGVTGVAIGWAWDAVFPINKALWTSSFVVYSAGLSLEWLGVCFWLIEIQGRTRWAAPFVIFGRNAIAAYVLSGIVAKLLATTMVPGPSGSAINLKEFLFERLFASWAAPRNASLLYALAYVLIWLAAMSVLSWKKIYIRV
jgi:predicted acyltransferase